MPKHYIIICKTCGKSARKPQTPSGKPIYCSRECYAKDVNRAPRSDKGFARVKRITFKCLQCGKEVTRTPGQYSNGRAKFCSISCNAKYYQTGKPSCNPSAGKRIKITCEQCGKDFEVMPYRVKQGARFCSNECFSKVHGENHPQWRGGASHEQSVNEWQQLAKSIRERDGYKCTKCNLTNDEHIIKYGRSLDVHHIVPFILSHDNHPNNLRSLCIKCHRRAERNFLWVL